ncbi:hypothetical protein ACFY8C_14575 [Streptomyces flavochromogenes]|uniref:HEAT repeat domain-containing protein n=1 Tax=Streptomyces flavochromogenes TaxID=68199 RepID=A0ABW6XPY2_9ACTN
MSDDRHVLDLLQDALGPEHAEESITHHGHKALSHLITALCWRDNNPNRAEYIASLGDLHRGDDEPVLAAIITAASWLKGDE